jgi:eukaryotic-like serine/threonine-protein kinase
MNGTLKPGQTVRTESSKLPCTVEKFLGGGGQGEVYQAQLAGAPVALKWYLTEYLACDPYVRQRLDAAIQSGAPSQKFLWPMELASVSDVDPGFGYVMPLREARYRSLVDLMRGKVRSTFRALSTAGLQLADSFLQLHAKGLCYRDISFGNVFFDPDTGDVLICDNDNVSVDGEEDSVIGGTPRFMAPEVVRGTATPSRQTDLFSLSVLLFYMFMVNHPLEGKREAEIQSLDWLAMKKIYGIEPIFIFDPDNDANRPVPGYQDNAIAFWPIYPQFLRDRFTEAFTKGLRDPQNGRVAESMWRATMLRLRDAIIYCPHCSSENFYDVDVLKSSANQQPQACISCQQPLQLPPRLRIGKTVVMLNYNTQLFWHHVDPQKLYDFSTPVAQVSRNPNDPSIWGLQNCSDVKWVITRADGSIKEVEPGRSITLAVGTRINFGKTEGEIRV